MSDNSEILKEQIREMLKRRGFNPIDPAFGISKNSKDSLNPKTSSRNIETNNLTVKDPITNLKNKSSQDQSTTTLTLTQPTTPPIIKPNNLVNKKTQKNLSLNLNQQNQNLFPKIQKKINGSLKHSHPLSDPTIPMIKKQPPALPPLQVNPTSLTQEFDQLKVAMSKKETTSQKNLLKIGMVFLAFCFLFVGSFLIYKITKEKQEETSIESNPVLTPVITSTPANSDDQIETTQDSQNLDSSTNTTSSLNLPKESNRQKHLVINQENNPFEIIKKYYSEVKTEPIEINFYKEDGTRLSIKELEEKSNLIIPQYIEETIAENYYFLISFNPKTKKPDAFLILDSVFADPNKTKESFQRWEPYIIKDLKPFMLIGNKNEFNPDTDQSAFHNSSKYPDGRYANIPRGDDQISLNYIVLKDKIIIANTFEAFNEAINYVQKRAE